MMREDGRYYLDFDLGDIAIQTTPYKGLIVGNKYKIISYNSGYKGKPIGGRWNLDVEDVLTGKRSMTKVEYLELYIMKGVCKDCINTCREQDKETCDFKEGKE